jgi:hypothetical protein
MQPTRRRIPAGHRDPSSARRRSRASAVAEGGPRDASSVHGRHWRSITPDLIPHSRFHTGAWLLPIERPDWYYFVRRRNTNTIANDRFLKSVDRPVRPLVRWLHERGIKTTPSCSGHHMAERSLEKIYEDLKRDGREIRNTGLRLMDIETGEIVLYRNPAYSLPWTRREFLRKAVVYQRRGVLGMRLASRKPILEQIRAARIPGVTLRDRDGVLFVFTDSDTGDNRRTWKRVTRRIKAVLGPNARDEIRKA